MDLVGNQDCWFSYAKGQFIFYNYSGGGIATDEDSLGLPLNVIDFQSLKPQLCYLLNVYGINFVSKDFLFSFSHLNTCLL